MKMRLEIERVGIPAAIAVLGFGLWWKSVPAALFLAGLVLFVFALADDVVEALTTDHVHEPGAAVGGFILFSNVPFPDAAWGHADDGLNVEVGMAYVLRSGGNPAFFKGKFIDANGNEAEVQNPRVQVSDESLLTINTSDGLRGSVSAVGPIGVAQLQIIGDGDLGDGVREITIIGDLEVKAGEAVSGAVEFSETETPTA